MERSGQDGSQELVPFSRKSFYYQASPMLLPSPPHRIAPLWKQSNKSVTKQKSRMNHLSRIIKQPSPPCPWTKTSPSPWLQHIVTTPQVSHTYHKTMVAPSGHLHHKATAKPSTLHRGHSSASAKLFPRANIGTRKPDVSLKADKQNLMLLLGSKHQLESPMYPDHHQTVDSSGLYSHFTKICRCHHQPLEKLPAFHQKPPIPSFSNYQTTEDPPCENHRTKAEAIHSTFPESQDLDIPATMSPGHQEETSQKSRQSFINRKYVIIIPSCDNQYYTWATAFESPNEAQRSMTSHPNMCPRETASLMRWADYPIHRALAVSPLHQRDRDTPAPSPKEQAEDILSPTDQAPFPMEVECWDATPSKTDPQPALVTVQDHESTTPLLLGPQDETLPGLDYLDTSQMNLNWLVKLFEHWKVIPPRTQNHAATQTGPDYGITPPLDTEEKILPDFSHEVATYTSADQQAKDVPKLVSQAEVNASTQTEEYWETMSLEREPQSTILDQDNETTPLLGSVFQDRTLPAFYQASRPPDSDHQLETAPDPNIQASFPPEYLKLSEGPEDQSIPSPDIISVHENQDKSVSEYTDYQQSHTPPTHLNNQETAQTRPNCRTRPLPGISHHKLASNHQDQVQKGPQQQAQSVPKRQGPRGFNYIKPYVIEGRSLPARIVRAIINSIPQEKIKKDMSKKILLWKTGESPTHGPDQLFSSNYMVCLVCASWIPYGCPHAQRTKYPFVTELLAVPVLLPGSKQKLYVKFVFQVPQATARNIFSLPYTHYCLQRPLHQLSNFPASSHSDPVLSKSTKKKWLQFLLGKNQKPKDKASNRSQPPCIKEMSRKRKRRRPRGSARELKQRGN